MKEYRAKFVGGPADGYIQKRKYVDKRSPPKIQIVHIANPPIEFWVGDIPSYNKFSKRHVKRVKYEHVGTGSLGNEIYTPKNEG